MSQTRFFSTKDDLLPLLARVESRGDVKYVRTGRFLSTVVQVYAKGADIPNLGIASSESATNCESFIICDPKLKIEARAVDQSDGVRSFHVDQLHNQDTITFSPGGVWKNDILLYGWFASVSDSYSQIARRLLQRFTYEVRKHFKHMGSCYVGPQAHEMLKAGKRLTIAEQSPREFDLPIPTESQ